MSAAPVICYWCRREEHANCGRPSPGVRCAPTEACTCICPPAEPTATPDAACECVGYTIRTDYGTGVEHDVDRSSCPIHGRPTPDAATDGYAVVLAGHRIDGISDNWMGGQVLCRCDHQWRTPEQYDTHLRAALSEAHREALAAERRAALEEAADEIARSFPLNGELRHDGTADPLASVYVEGLHDAWAIVRAAAQETP